jgi:hypothetical protein
MEPCVLSCGHFGKFVKNFVMGRNCFGFACSHSSKPMPICLLQALFPHPICGQVNKCKPRFEFLFMVSDPTVGRLIRPTKPWLACCLPMREFGRLEVDVGLMLTRFALGFRTRFVLQLLFGVVM